MILPIIATLSLYQVLGDPIIGGQQSQIHEYPWLASIQRDGYHKCSGSIISPTVILTAAHCTENPPYVVRVGSTRIDSGGSLHEVVEIRRHDNYSISSIYKQFNDVALMEVSPAIELGKHGAQIRLPEKGYVTAAGTKVSTIGWGSTFIGGPTSDELRSASMGIIDSGECSRHYGDRKSRMIESNHQICAQFYESGPCKGDSGGPIVIEGDIQVGIVSWTFGCAEHPVVHEDVAYYSDWIDKNSKNI